MATRLFWAFVRLGILPGDIWRRPPGERRLVLAMIDVAMEAETKQSSGGGAGR